MRTRVEEVVFSYRGSNETKITFVRTKLTDWNQPWVTRKGVPVFRKYMPSLPSRVRLMAVLRDAINRGIIPSFRTETFESGLKLRRFDVRNLVNGVEIFMHPAELFNNSRSASR